MGLRETCLRLTALLLLGGASCVCSAELELSAEETQYLRERGPVKVCVDPNWMPFEAINRQGQHTGVSADFMKEYAKMLGVKLQLVPTENWSESMHNARERLCDVLPMINQSPERAQFLNFTVPYVSMPVVLITDLKATYLDGLKSLEGEKLAIPDGYIFAEYVRNNFPQLDVIYPPSLLESLRAVMKGEVTAAMATLPIALYQIERHGMNSLKIGGHTDFTIELGIGIRNDDLLLTTAFQKAVLAITEQQRDEILSRWYNIEVEQARDYTLLLVLVGILSVFAVFLAYRNYNSRQFNAQLSKVNARLNDRNQRLEQLAKRDYLTGVYHRVNMDAELERDIEHCSNNGQPLNIILFDLDDFSKLNVDYGHAVGDLVLVEMSRLVEERLPDNVQFGRWGGDSFLILCPHTPVDIAQKTAEALASSIHSHRFTENIQLSATFVVATCHPHQKQACVMKDVERRIRQLKQESPGRVVFMDSANEN
ncbi:transporter substrate-binding domain-containing protein [Pontibacterium granulatum]|uniref:diguanylate cyclase n=1 Tax=Pontibacterium granulatum TaxID=2036029 RepID=UPI00249AC261|nr:transporter substrate-binding domain-containing protein [Pontibacterium granulatum]MDI3323874.1 transporter substrate-binding domain-containing protein [Pontibacterium granulatum]